MKLIAHLKKWFEGVKVIDMGIFGKQSDLANEGFHAAIWGNYEEEIVTLGISRIGPRVMLGIKVDDPQSLRTLTDRNCNKLRQYFKSLNFIWSGDLMVFDAARPPQVVMHTHDLGPYYEKV